jgi:Holliday junction resolvasome RuvABC endonuclease subunit
VSAKPPLTFGIDYGTRKISIAGMYGSNLYILDDVDFGLRKKELDSHHLLPLLIGVVDQHLANEHPVLVALESPIVGSTKNLQTTIKLAMVAGAVMAYLVEQNIPTILVPPGSWKMACLGVGHGNASKDEVLTWASKRWPYATTYDRADAIGLATYAQHHHTQGES